jgi:hypothetical protein
MAIAIDMGKTNEIRTEIMPKVGRSVFWGSEIFLLNTYISAAKPARVAL